MLKYSHINPINSRFCYQINEQSFVEKIKIWASQFDLVAYYDSQGYYQDKPSAYSYQKYEYIFGFKKSYSIDLLINKTHQLESLLNEKKDWLLGYFAYDLKNELFNLESKNQQELGFEDLFFFRPEMLIYKQKDAIILESLKEINIEDFTQNILKYQAKVGNASATPEFKAKQSKETYINNVNQLKHHIQIGDIYEVNYCQEFSCKAKEVDLWKIHEKLCTVSPTPFSAYFKQNTLFLSSASPERFITKRGSKIISQPIKGTIRTGENQNDNQALATQLKNDPKEQAENVMIVDLVRNDLSQTARKGSVKVEELFGIYPFKQLYQMISTISSEKDDKYSPLDVILSCFPMGSMTGAPKKRAMKLIDQYENSRRTLFSGAVGYFDPEADFDFNVVIRSLFYDATQEQLAYTVGSAITIKSDAEKEYEECLLKAKAIREVFS